MKFILRTSPTRLMVIGFVFVFGFSTSQAEQQPNNTAPGKFLGAMETSHPDWFKESFLEFEDDIEEAAAENKRLVLYFHQDGCPYCNKLVEDNFRNDDIKATMLEHFDLVAINMWGDREVIQVGGRSFTEKTLAAALSVNFTPTLLFFSEDKQVALRLDGYYPPEEMQHALAYVSLKKEKSHSYAEYLASVKPANPEGELNPAPWLSARPHDLTQSGNKPVAVLFEEPDCSACDILHQKTLTNPEASGLLSQFHVIQLNRHADTEVMLSDGGKTTAKQWADALGLGFSPSIVFFDQDGQFVMKIDAMFKTFHILGAFDYVASESYLSEPSFQRYLSERAEHIISTGKDVNIWSY